MKAAPPRPVTTHTVIAGLTVIADFAMKPLSLKPDNFDFYDEPATPLLNLLELNNEFIAAYSSSALNVSYPS